MIAKLLALPSLVKFALAGAALVLLAYNAGKWRGASQADVVAEARAAKATIEQLRERGMINEKVSKLSDCELMSELGADCRLLDNGNQ